MGNRQFCIRGIKIRHIHFSQVCFTLLKTYLNERMCDSESLFCKNGGNKLDQPWLQFLFKKLSNDMGIKVSPHTLRRSASTHFRE
ncbi:tyrosine-type recombinase/integrase [Sporosarcina highlanderae]|uniref:tyrosine-type recombinase/integrase n=1 Tax=Sporosarcina highlanderae TaxID=3035916 RepID=UPI0034355B7E